MDSLLIDEIIFDGGVLEIVREESSGKEYVAVRWACEEIGLSAGQTKNERKKIQEDPLLLHGVKMLSRKTNGGSQIMLHLKLNYLPVWLSSINRKSLNYKQLEKTMGLVNYTISDTFTKRKIPTSKFLWEAELNDELFKLGNIDGYQLVDQEVNHEYGRVDLLARDLSGKLVCFELKKDQNYNDVIKQCSKYKKGLQEKFGEEVDVVIVTLDKDKEFLVKAERMGYKVYEYKRKLDLQRIV